MLPKKERNRVLADKNWALQGFLLKDDQLYRKPEKSYGERVVAMTYNAAQYIVQFHDAIGHNGVRKTHQKLVEEVYGIS